LHPQVLDALGKLPQRDLDAPDAGQRATEVAAVRQVVEGQRSGDRTWSVPEMVDRLHRAMVQAIDAGAMLVPCLQGPAPASQERPGHDQAVATYIEHFRSNAFTHERVEALADYLSRMTKPVNGVEYTGSAGYREYCEEEYRLAIETYSSQRVWVRDVLHLGENDPDVLYMVKAPADADTAFHGRVVVGHSDDGYRVGLLPAEDGLVQWADAVPERSVADELAQRLHREGHFSDVAMDSHAVGGVQP
jgi:hypothetical protein